MSISVSLLRVPLERAVDVLSQRVSLIDFIEYVETELAPYDPEARDPDRTSPELHLWKGYVLVLDVLTEKAHEHHLGLFIREEFSEPLAWAAFGARLPGWQIDYPLRYSLGSDLDAICRALEVIDEQEIERRVHRVLELAPQYEEGHDPWVLAQMSKVFPAIREFYRQARSASEVVIHRMF